MDAQHVAGKMSVSEGEVDLAPVANTVYGADWEDWTNETSLFRKHRDVSRVPLERIAAQFREVTGLRCHVCWVPSLSCPWNGPELPEDAVLCLAVEKARGERGAQCRACAKRHLRDVRDPYCAGIRFTCCHGVRNFWQPIVVRHRTVALVFVQALAGEGRLAARNGHLGRAKFNEAVRVLKLLFGNAETLIIAQAGLTDFVRSQEVVSELRKISAHMRQELSVMLPAINRSPPEPEQETRAEQIVRIVLDLICQNYGRQITLSQCAESVRLNPAYLSALFSRKVGLCFRTCLTEVRIEKAKELLGDPRINLSEIAAAIGYGSENRFRIAFKRSTGLPPRVWRERLRLKPLRHSVI